MPCVRETLRILHVPHAYAPVIGGAELVCKRVSEILVARGHDVRVLTTDVGAAQAYYEFGVSAVADVKRVATVVPVKRLTFCGSLYRAGGWANKQLRPRWLGRRIAHRIRQHLLRRLDREIAKEILCTRPDVVMTLPHVLANVESVMAARARLDFPLVMVPMLHEQDPNWNIKFTAERLAIADSVVALTSHEADRLAEIYRVPHHKIFLASVGIDMDGSLRSPSDRPKRVVFLGRQVKSKGIGDLVEAMRLVWVEHPDAELTIAGVRVPESAELDAQLAALPDRYRSRVREIGNIPEDEKVSLLRSSRCLVLPSRNESFGMVILEAWAQQTPPVTWDLPVFRSIVDHGQTGLLVPPDGGFQALAAPISRLLSAPDEAARIGLAGYRKANNKFSWSHVANVYLDAYQHAIREYQTRAH